MNMTVKKKNGRESNKHLRYVKNYIITTIKSKLIFIHIQ